MYHLNCFLKRLISCYNNQYGVFNTVEHHITWLVIYVVCTQASFHSVYFTKHSLQPKCSACMKLVKRHEIFQLLLHFFSAVEVCNISRHMFFIRILHTSRSNSTFFILEKKYLPQFWSPCFVVLPLFLVRLYLFKISRDICIVCNSKAVGSARACICISNISLFTGLELKLKSFRLAANITSLFCWSFFCRRSYVKPFYAVPFFVATWYLLFYRIPCFPGESCYPVSPSI